jgi:hypothetical protein
MFNSLLTGGYAALLLISTAVTGASGEMQRVNDWGAHTPKVNMYIHTSRKMTEKLAAKLAGKPPIVVMVHYHLQAWRL